MDNLTKASNQFNLPQHIITLVSNDSGYALDDQNEVFYLLLHVNSSNACAFPFDYNSLIDAEVKEFNSDSGTARKIGRAVVGDVLFGDVGAIVGAVSTSALYNVELIIKTTNLKNPSNTYTLCSYAKQGSIAYESAHYFGEKIVAVVNNIAKQYHGSIGAGKSPNIDPDHIDATITRIELFLEDKEWQIARTYCDGALDYAPDNSMLYLLRCCANEHQSSLHDLIVYSDLNQNNPDYIKALRFADAELKETLDNYGQERKCEDTYNKAIFVLDTGDDALQKKDIENSANAFIQGRNLLLDISDYKNARSLISDCQDKLYKIASDKDNNDIKSVEIAQRCLRELGKYQKTDELISYYDYKNQEFKKITDHANSLLKEDWSSFNDTYEILKTLEECLRIGDHEDADKLQAYVNSITGREREYAKASQLLKGKKLSALIKAKDILSAYPDYKNSQELLLTCNDKIQLIENYNKKKKQKWIIIILAFVILLSIFIVISRVIYPSILYKNGVAYYKQGDYRDAVTTLSKISKYKDSNSYIKKSNVEIEKQKYINGEKSLLRDGDFALNGKETQEIIYLKYKSYGNYQDVRKEPDNGDDGYYHVFLNNNKDDEVLIEALSDNDATDEITLHYSASKFNSDVMNDFFNSLTGYWITKQSLKEIDRDIKKRKAVNYSTDYGMLFELDYGNNEYSITVETDFDRNLD